MHSGSASRSAIGVRSRNIRASDPVVVGHFVTLCGLHIMKEAIYLFVYRQIYGLAAQIHPEIQQTLDESSLTSSVYIQ